MKKTFEAKLEIYVDRTNYNLPLAAKDLGPLQVLEFNRRSKRMVLGPGGDPRRTGTTNGNFRRYQYTAPSDAKYCGTFRMQGRVENGKIILEQAPFKRPEEVFG